MYFLELIASILSIKKSLTINSYALPTISPLPKQPYSLSLQR
jgi:hypothetical protein